MFPDNLARTVQADLVQCYDYFKNSNLNYQNIKNFKLDKTIKNAAVRILTTLGIAFGALMGVVGLSFFASSPVGSVLLMALAALIIRVCSDIFIIFENKDSQKKPLAKIASETVTVSKNIWKISYNWFQDKETLNVELHHSLSQRTYFCNFWDRLLNFIDFIDS